MKNRSFGVIFLIGITATLYFVAQAIGDLQSWAAWDQPAEAKRLLEAVAAGGVTMLAALGVNVKDLLGSFTGGSPLDAANKSGPTKLGLVLLLVLLPARVWAQGPPVLPVSVLAGIGQQQAVVVTPAVATIRFDQGPCSVTTTVVVQPSQQANGCGGAGTPSWITDRNTTYCLFSVASASGVNWTASVAGTTPTTGITPTGQTWAGPGIYSITGRLNLLNFKMIATTATTSVYISCGW